MFLISDKVDKEMSRNYETLPEEKMNSTEQTTTQDDKPKSGGCEKFMNTAVFVYTFSFIAVWFVIQMLTSSRSAVLNGYGPSYVELDQRMYSIAMKAINDTQFILTTVRKQTDIIHDTNNQQTTKYLTNLREVLKQRTDYSVKKISQLIFAKVQDIENQLAVFERVISTSVKNNLDISQNQIRSIQSDLAKVQTENATSLLNDAIKQVEYTISQLNIDLDQMFSYYGRYINDILYHKAQDIIDRIRMILIADRKRLRELAPAEQMYFCYNISTQNYEITNNLEKVLGIINLLHNTTNIVDTIFSTFPNDNENRYPLITKSKYALSEALNSTKTLFYFMMNSDENFIGTVLKELAYKEHTQMKNFIFKNYETAILNLESSLKKASSGFTVVKDSLWQQITKAINPVLDDLGKEIKTKASLIGDVQRKTIIENSDFKSVYTLMSNKFRNATTTVNSLFSTKQGQMMEGISMSLDAMMDEKLPLISTWSIQNYIPSNACPMSVDYQTYLKTTMEQNLDQLANLKVVTGILNETLDLDSDFNSIDSDEDNSDEKETDVMNIQQLDIPSEKGTIGSLIDMIESMLSQVTNAGFTVDGPIEVYLDDDDAEKKKK